MKKLAVIFATGFGLGLSPVASGTFGSLLGILIVYAMIPLSLMWQIGVAAVLVLLAIPICGAAEDYYGTVDDGRIVADEYMTFPICMIGLEWGLWTVVVSFVVCRFFDIVKIPPARQCESLAGGLGIVMDDVFASLYALAVNHFIFHFIWPHVEGFIAG